MRNRSNARRGILRAVAWCGLAGALAGPLCSEWLVDSAIAHRSVSPELPAGPDCPCGVVAAAVVLHCLGQAKALEDVRHVVPVDPLARTSMAELLTALGELGLAAAPVRIDAATLRLAATPAVLFVNHSHFVAVIPAAGQRMVLIDPPSPPLLISGRELERIWNGEAILVAADSGRLAERLREIRVDVASAKNRESVGAR